MVKLGGSALEPDGALRALQRLVRREASRARLVLVHGGSPEIELLHRRAGLACETRDGLRVTSPAGAKLVERALCGIVAPRVVDALAEIGVPAEALRGLDDGLLRARYLDRERLGRVGAAPRVDVAPIRALLERGVLPVISPLAAGPEGEILNVNGDVAAAAVARALHARRIDLVTTTAVRNPHGEPIVSVPLRRLQSLIDDEIATDGMIPKLDAARLAVGERSRGEPLPGRPVPVARIGGFGDFARGRATRIEGAGGADRRTDSRLAPGGGRPADRSAAA